MDTSAGYNAIVVIQYPCQIHIGLALVCQFDFSLCARLNATKMNTTNTTNIHWYTIWSSLSR